VRVVEVVEVNDQAHQKIGYQVGNGVKARAGTGFHHLYHLYQLYQLKGEYLENTK